VARCSTLAARRERDAEAKRLVAEGWQVRKWSEPNQLISRGGIGSGHPHIEEVVTVFGLNASREDDLNGRTYSAGYAYACGYHD